MRADYHRLDQVVLGSFGILAVTALAASCGGSSGPTTPSQPPLPVASESASFRYHYAAGDTVDAAWQAVVRQRPRAWVSFQ